jgi:carbamoyltransferase
VARQAILGISAFYHDSAAALLVDGRIAAAAQEERFSRKRHDASFPIHACRYVLDEAGVGYDDLAAVAFYDKPFLKFERLLETYHGFAPSGLTSFVAAMPTWIKEKLFMRRLLADHLGELGQARHRVLYPEHHLSHAASAFYPSPFDEAAILTIDGVGEWATTTIGRGRGRDLEILSELHFPHSVGLLYSALDVRPDGSLVLNMAHFEFATGLRMVHEPSWERLFGMPRRAPDVPLAQPHMDLALAIQQVTEDVVLRLARTARDATGCRDLVMAGGVALNCVANGKLLASGLFDDLWIQPAAGDAGGAVGAAYAAWHIHRGEPRPATSGGACDAMAGSYLGPQFSDLDAERTIRTFSARATCTTTFDTLARDVAARLAAGQVGGWFQGRMEFGPRALGNRSILGDARNPDMQKRLNLKVKFREGFRPFAPSVLEEDVSEHFDLDRASPYMLLVAPLRSERQHAFPPELLEAPLYDRLYFQRSHLPAITHVDYSARIQTVSHATNPRYWTLLRAFKALTGCGVLVNTSFNVRGEPVVCTPDDAYRCFMRTDMDFLVIGNHVFEKADQPPLEEKPATFAPD